MGVISISDDRRRIISSLLSIMEAFNMRNFMNKEEAFTGLEAAIVLIAFVVVAAVFSYVVLGAGFYTTQKSQEVIYTSVAQASSSVEVLGDVYGTNNGTTTGLGVNNVTDIRFTVGLTAGGSPVDFNTVTMTWSTPKAINSLDCQLNNSISNVIIPGKEETGYKDLGFGNWTVSEIDNPTGNKYDALLENQEQFTIRVNLPSENLLSANEKFSLEIRPAVGTSYAIKRSAPAKIDAVNTLY